MKTILATVDFTEASHNAAQYATELAKAFNAKLILLNAYNPVPVPVSELMVTVAPDNPTEAAKYELKQETEALDPVGVVDIETECGEGRPADVIMEAVNRWQPDIIIAGMKMHNKGIRRLFGSTVTSLIGKITTPLLVIPEEAEYTPPRIIALATDADINPHTNTHAVDALCEIAQRFYSKLYIVRIVKDLFDEAYEMQNRPFKLNRIVHKLNPEYVYPYGSNVLKTLNDFVAAKDISMLAMIAHQHNIFERWFVTSATRAMTFQTHIPLLIVPEKK